MEEILQDARTLDRSPRVTIKPDRSRADRAPGSPTDRGARAGEMAIELLRKLERQEGAGIEIRGTIGEGGMGVVHAGQQVALGREVAVKTLKQEARGEAATLKLLREAWVTGALEHPNVVPVYDISLDATGSPQIVLKRIGGAAWCDVLRDEKAIRQRYSARDAFEWNVRILMQVCNAVHFAHSRGILHRDLKPENVMIGEFGEVYVLDWGIAVSIRDDGTGRLPLAKDACELAGTPAYMAPEMLGGKTSMLCEATDVYLLGAILFEIISGRPPHDGETMGEILEQVIVSKPVLPEGTPEELVRVVRRAMDPDRDARFETAEQLRLALVGVLEHRGSIKLAEDAEARLRDLETERMQPGDDHDEKRLRLYHLFGECRFGFLEALRIWRDNEAARQGLRRAILTMIDLELEQGDPKAAALLLAELEDPPAEVARRVTEARATREAEDRRREHLARDLDPSIGRRTRAFVGTVLGTMWTIFPAIAYFLERRMQGTFATAIASTAAMLLVAGAMTYWARDSLSRTAINRRLVRSVGLVLVGQAALFAASWMLGLEYTQARALLIVHYTVCAALIAATVEGRLWPSALAYLIVLPVAVSRSDLAFLLEAIANLVVTINVVVIWGQLDTDLVNPLRERHEARKRAWREFLERKRMRESTPEPGPVPNERS
jgi:serine/threonine-protein kinase